MLLHLTPVLLIISLVDARVLLNVVTVLNPPFVMIRNDGEDKERYEGFAIDLLDELTEVIGFDYNIKLADDAKYGAMDANGTWDGIIGEVIAGRADLGVADLMITSKRAHVVDYSLPFMTTGIGILVKKPRLPPTNLYCTPLLVWSYLVVTFFIITGFLMIRKRQWRNKTRVCYNFPVDDKDTKGLSLRFFSCSWKLFILILTVMSLGSISIYISYLQLPQLTVIESIDDLLKQHDVTIGLNARTGWIRYFFKDAADGSKYQAINNRIWEENLVNSNREGVERANKGNYAFLMDSVAIDYVTKRYCNLTRVGGVIDPKGFGLAMRKGFPLRDAIDQAILKLQERGLVEKLRHHWWDTNHCEDERETTGSIESTALEYLTFAAGVAVIPLVLGFVFELIACVCGKLCCKKL